METLQAGQSCSELLRAGQIFTLTTAGTALVQRHAGTTELDIEQVNGASREFGPYRADLLLTVSALNAPASYAIEQDLGLRDARWLADSSALVGPDGSTLTGSNLGTPVTGFSRFQPGFAAADGRIVTVMAPGIPRAQHATNITNHQLLDAIALAPNTPPPETARALLLYVDVKIEAGGSAGTHEANIAFYWDHAGTRQWYDQALTCYEPAGIAAGTWIGGGALTMIAPITGEDLEVTMKFADSWGAGSTTEIQGISILGYYD